MSTARPNKRQPVGITPEGTIVTTWTRAAGKSTARLSPLEGDALYAARAAERQRIMALRAKPLTSESL